ncbi:MAG: hypothetical protein JNL57_04005 [Bacteroidetes bacterium]|nr:hypothetical protein [Bacteroidota bacterium]
MASDSAESTETHWRPGKMESLRVAVNEVFSALSKRDTAVVQNYIHPVYGFWMIVRPGAIDYLVHEKTLSRGWTKSGRIGRLDSVLPLQLGKAPVFHCETNTWNRAGFFVDTLRNDNRLLQVVQFLNEQHLQKFTPVEISSIYTLLATDVKVVYTKDREDLGVTFQLSWIGGRWWLSVLNLVESDCSA